MFTQLFSPVKTQKTVFISAGMIFGLLHSSKTALFVKANAALLSGVFRPEIKFSLYLQYFPLPGIFFKKMLTYFLLCIIVLAF